MFVPYGSPFTSQQMVPFYPGTGPIGGLFHSGVSPMGGGYPGIGYSPMGQPGYYGYRPAPMIPYGYGYGYGGYGLSHAGYEGGSPGGGLGGWIGGWSGQPGFGGIGGGSSWNWPVGYGFQGGFGGPMQPAWSGSGVGSPIQPNGQG